MPYHVTRNGQVYGPYTLEDLQRYVAAGNILPTDLAKSEATPEWLPVRQILGAAGTPPPSYTPGYPTQPLPALNPNAFQDPPNLPWGLVLLFTILTCGLFMAVWNIVVSAWMKRVQPNSQALLYYIAGTVLLLLNSSASFGYLFAFRHHHLYHAHPFAGAVGLIGWVIRLIARFQMKASLEEHFNGPEPLGLRLSSAMTLFFGGLYHQYHLNRITEVKQALRFRSPFPSPSQSPAL